MLALRNTDKEIDFKRTSHFLLFLRYAIIFIGSYMALATLGLLLYSTLYDQQRQAQTGLQVQSVHDLLKEGYRNAPEQGWPSLTDALVKKMGLPVRLVPLAEVSAVLSSAMKIHLKQGDVVIHPDGRRTYQRLFDSKFALELTSLDRMNYLGDSLFVDYHLGELLMFLLLGVAFIVPLYFLVYRLWRDVYVLGCTARAIQSGEFTIEAAVPRIRLVWPLYKVLKDMASQLKELVEGQRILSQAVAHESRTPLARMRFALEMVDVDPLDSESRCLLDDVLRDVGRLERLAAAGIRYAELGRFTSFQCESICAKQLVEDLQASFDASPTGVALVFEAPSLVMLSANHDALLLALGNLISNALRHAATQVVVSMQMEKEMAVIAVDDDGDGVAQSAWLRVFQPYVQLRAHPDGVGLGLAMVQVIASRHGGYADVKNSSLGGARFRFLLPVIATSPLD